MWGFRQDWKKAENVTPIILQQEGYENVKILTAIWNTPFDITATKDGKRYVFQVTTRTHTSKRRAHILANELDLIHKILFVSVATSRYVLKDFSKGGIAELGLEEVLQARRYV